MEIGATGSSASAAAGTAKGLKALSTEDFLKMLLTELTNQDPFEPVKNQDLLNQIGSIRDMEMNSQLTSTLQNLILRSDLSSAGGLIGKTVAGLSSVGRNVEGLVTGVRVVEGNVLLDLDSGHQVNIADVTRVRQGPTADAVTG